MELQEIDDSYPQFVRDNQAYFERLGFIDRSRRSMEGLKRPQWSR